MARLGELCRFINGDRGKNYPSQTEISSDGDVPFINAGHIVDGKLDFSDMNYISKEKYNQLNSGKIQENDVLYCLRGSLGKKAIIKGISKGAIASSLVIIRPDARLINSDYLFYALESPTVQEQMMQANNGSSQPNLSAKSVSEYTFNLPDIDVQIEIVSKLAKVNDLIALRKEQLAKLDQLVKSRFIELFGHPIANEMHWEQVPLSTCIESIDNGKSFVCDSDARQGEWPAVLKLSAATYGMYRPEENKAMLDKNQFVEGAAVRAGDLLFTRKNTPELVGMCAYVYDTPGGLMMPDLIFRLNTTEKCNKIYLWKLINHDLFRECIQAIATGSAKSMSNISKERLLNLTVILPPMELQAQFAAFVEQTDKSKMAIQQSLDKLELLKKALMQEYFG